MPFFQATYSWQILLKLQEALEACLRLGRKVCGQWFVASSSMNSISHCVINEKGGFHGTQGVGTHGTPLDPPLALCLVS